MKTFLPVSKSIESSRSGTSAPLAGVSSDRTASLLARPLQTEPLTALGGLRDADVEQLAQAGGVEHAVGEAHQGTAPRTPPGSRRRGRVSPDRPCLARRSCVPPLVRATWEGYRWRYAHSGRTRRSTVNSLGVMTAGATDTIPVLEGEAAAAVAHRGGHVQIIAAAGSGKTEVVSQRVASLLRTGSQPSRSWRSRSPRRPPRS